MPDRDAPIYFMMTGFPKGGNKWFLKMMASFESVGGYGRDLERRLPLLGRPVVENQRLLELLAAEHVSLDAFVRKLFDLNANVTLGLSERGRTQLRSILAELAVEAGKIAKQTVPVARLEAVLDESAWPAPPPTPACGTAGMHVPIRHIQSVLPSFRVIHLQRDPRDAVVSYFYHLIATMNPDLVRSFVSYDKSTGNATMNPRWKSEFAQRYMRRVRRFFTGPPLDPQRVLTVRYEDLLTSCGDELQRVLGILGCTESRERIDEVVEQLSFESVTGGLRERRRGMTRKGQTGDWRNYFDRDLIDALGRPFRRVVRDLGYEQDDEWTKSIPATAPRQFEFSRFRVRRSTVRAFIRYWEQSEELQRRYPNPYGTQDDESFYTWLLQCPHAEVQQWFELARRLHDLWQVDIAETVDVAAS